MADVLSSTGRELLRSQRVAQCEAQHMAHGSEHSPACIQSDDWRVKLGAAGALSLLGAPALCGAPEIRQALEEESSRALVLETLARSQPGRAVGNAERLVRLLTSEDWRLRFGALESLLRHAEVPPALPLTGCCLDAWEPLRRRAQQLLRRLPSEAAREVLCRAVKEGLARCDACDPVALRETEDLLLQLMAGDAKAALEVVEESTYFADLVRKKEEEDAEFQRQEELRQQEEEELRGRQHAMQSLQLQWLDLLPPKQVAEMEHTAPVLPVPREKAVALKRRARRKAQEEKLDADWLGDPYSAREMSREDRWVEESAQSLRMAETFQQLAPAELSAHISEILEWLSTRHQDGISSHLRRIAAELLGRLADVPPAAQAALIAQLHADDAQLRKVAIGSLGRLHCAAALEDLAEALGDPEPLVRKAAAHALAGCGVPGGQAAAGRLRSGNAEARKAAQQALLEMELEETPSVSVDTLRLQALLPLLDPLLHGDEQPETVSSVAAVLEQLRSKAHQAVVCSTWIETDTSVEADEKALHSALGLLQDPSEATRVVALQRLQGAVLRGRAVGCRLAKALGDSTQAVRVQTVQLLRACRDEECLEGALQVAEDLAQHPLQTVRRAAVAVLDLDPAMRNSVARHRALLKDDDPNLRCSAAEALSQQPDALKRLEDEGRLKQFLTLSIDNHWSVRLAVAEGLSALSDATRRRCATEVSLLCADSDWRVRRAAERARTQPCQVT